MVDYKKILILIFQILLRILGVGLLILGLTGLPTIFSDGGVTTNIITLLLRLVNVLSYVIVGYGLVRMRKWSIYGLIALIIISILIPFHNLYISTTPNIPQQSLSFSRAVFFIIVYLITLIFKNILFSKENLTSLIKKSNKSQCNFEESEKLNNIGENQQNRYGYLYKFSIFTAAVVVVCLLMIFARNNNLNLSLKRNNSKYLTPTPTINSEEEDKTTHYDNIIVDNYEIVDTYQDPPVSTGLKLSKKESSSQTNLVKWKNYLIAINMEFFVDKVPDSTMNNKPSESTRLYNKIDSIRVYNLDSKESFNLQLEEPIIESYYGDVISQLFENKLYFGASSKEGFGLFEYKLDLPPSKNSKVIKLPKSIGNKIEKIGNVYISSFCYEGCSYTLFNSTSSTETVLTRMNKAANGYDEDRTEKLIGIDSRGRMIINSVKDNMIAAVPLTNEKLTIPLIKKDKLPTKIVDFSMINGIDKILMLGELKAYIYDINQDKFVEIQTNQETNNWRSYRKTGSAVCLFPESKGIKKETVSAVDLTTNSYLEVPPDDCFNKKQKTVDEVFKELKLPDNYELKDATLEFQTYWRYL